MFHAVSRESETAAAPGWGVFFHSPPMRNFLRRAAYAILGVALFSCTENSITGPDRMDPEVSAVSRLANAVTAPAIVISQIYGGGGNSGATFQNDFIEVFNPGVASVTVSNWSVQYASATGTTWQVTSFSGTIPAGGYYLVKEASGGAIGSLLPTADATGTINMSATVGKVFLANNSTALSGACPTGAAVIDQVSFGTTASDCGFGRTPAPSNTTAELRGQNGCTYTQVLANDFATGTPNPRNSASTKNQCQTGTTVDHITLSPATATILSGTTQQFTASAFDAANNPVGGVTFTWGSTNTTIATVNASGLATADGVAGSTTISASANGKTGTATLTVTVVDHVSVAPSTASIVVGGTQQFAATAFDAGNNVLSGVSFTWSSSDNAIGTVSSTGLATAVAQGSATITAKTPNNVTGTASMTVIPPPPPADVVISQVYGGGGNSGAPLSNDYIELFNRSNAPVSLTGWSVQHASAAGTSWSVTPLSGSIQPGKYYLVQESAGANNPAPLPAPDAFGSIAMGASNGKDLLVRTTAAQTGACPTGGVVQDRMSYGTGSGANDVACAVAWGTRMSSDLSNTLAAFRANDGCINTGVPSVDFQAFTPAPRNSASAAKSCVQPVRSQSSATLVINELMQDPVNAESASWGQWFEVYNYGASPIDMQGWTIVSPGTNQPDHTIASSVVVPAGGYAVLGRGGDPTRNGGVTLNYNYFVGNSSTIWLDATNDFLMLVDNAGARVDSVAWTSMPHGVTKGLRDAAQDNANVDGANWGYSTDTFGQGDYGTPGLANGQLDDSPPAVSTNHITISGRVASDAPLPVGFEAQLFPTELNQSNQTVTGVTFTWSPLTPSLASVDQLGVIHSLSPGTAVFRVVSSDGTVKNHSLVMETGTLGNAQYGNNTEFGDPTDTDASDDFIVRRAQYTTSYNRYRGEPNWVSYDLNGSQFVSGTDRCNCFTMDPLLPADFPHLATSDYTGAGGFAGYGIDRGHMTRSSDRTTGTLDNADTYYLSNVVPQAADLNQGPWSNMEQYLHDLAGSSNKEIYIITGPAGINTTSTPGSNGTVKNEGKIVIPASTWKIAVIMNRGQGLADVHSTSDLQVIAVNMPNIPGIRNVDWHDYQTTVHALEQLTGYNFLAALPDNIEVVVEGTTQAPSANAGGPYTVAEGSSLALNGTGSDPDGDAITYGWTFGDGGSANGASTSHTYADNGNYSAQLTTTDTFGATGTSTANVVVTNVAPVANAGTDGTVSPGATFTLQASLSDAGVNDAPWNYTITWGDGNSSTGSRSSQGGFTATHSYATSGSFAVHLTVTDKDGGSGSDDASVTVLAAPTAIANGPYASSEGSPVILSGAGSADADGSVVSYAWDFGDGSTGTGTSPSHIYAQDGDYTATLTVTDNDGLTGTTTSVVHVENVAPILGTITGARFPTGGTYTASGSFEDPGSDAWTATVDYGDGSGVSALSLAGKTFSLSHTYAAPGTFTVTVRVRDDHTDAVGTSTVSVLAAPTAATDGPYASSEGSGVSMSAAGSADSDGSVVSYAWNFGDGSTATGATQSHTYAQDGDYTITVTVTDNDGLTGTTTATAHVTNVAPSSAMFTGATIVTGDTYTSSGSFTDPGSDSWTATADFGDGSGANPLLLSGKTFALSHKYTSAGSFTVTVRITDDHETSTSTQTVVVHAPPVSNAGGPYSSTEGASVALSGASSSDVDGSIVSYAWTFGDGGTGSGVSVSHTYAQDGNYTVTLVVTDNDGLTGSSTTTVIVSNVAPAIAAFAGATLLPGETYSASGSFTDPGADSWTATVNYGDGSGTSSLTLSGKTLSLSHKYTAAGTYTVTVSVSDDDIASTRTQTVTVLTAVAAIDNAQPLVDQLLSGNKIGAANATSIHAKLSNAQDQINRGNKSTAINQLNAALNELDGLVGAGRLTSSDAAALRSMIVRIIQTLS